MHCAQCCSVRISPDAHRNIEWKGFTSFCWVLVLGSRVHVLLLGLVLVLGSRVLVMGLRFRFKDLELELFRQEGKRERMTSLAC